MQKNEFNVSDDAQHLQNEIKDVQERLLNDLFEPHECAESLDSWERVFENVAFHTHSVVISKEFMSDLELFYSMLKNIRRLADLSNALDDITD